MANKAAKLITITAAVFLLSAERSHATSVIAIWTPTRILIGADSKGRAAARTETRTICKISVANNVVAGKSGIFYVPKASFQIDEIISTALARDGNLATKVSSFENMLLPKLTTLLRGLSLGDPSYYRVHYAGQATVEMVFAANEDGLFRIETRDFISIDDVFNNFSSVRIERKSCPNNYCADPTYIALGQHKVVDREIAQDPQMATRLGLKETIVHLIESEIMALPDDVGPPITVAEVTQTGPRWIDKDPCPAP